MQWLESNKRKNAHLLLISLSFSLLLFEFDQRSCFFCCFNAGKHCRIIFQLSIAADCVFEVIFVLIYSCTCQVSLSELCRLPVSNRKLSAHISVPWTEKKISKRQQSFACGSRSGPAKVVLLVASARLEGDRGEWGPRWGVGAAACRGPCAARQPASCRNRTSVSAAESAAAPVFAKSAWQLSFTSAFFAT